MRLKSSRQWQLGPNRVVIRAQAVIQPTALVPKPSPCDTPQMPSIPLSKWMNPLFISARCWIFLGVLNFKKSRALVNFNCSRFFHFFVHCLFAHVLQWQRKMSYGRKAILFLYINACVVRVQIARRTNCTLARNAHFTCIRRPVQ